MLTKIKTIACPICGSKTVVEETANHNRDNWAADESRRFICGYVVEYRSGGEQQAEYRLCKASAEVIKLEADRKIMKEKLLEFILKECVEINRDGLSNANWHITSIADNMYPSPKFNSLVK